LTLGNAIKLVRTANGIKQRVLAKKLGMSANYLSLVENGKREPSISFLNRLAKVLGVPVGVFFLWQEVGPGQGADNQNLDQIRELLVRLEAVYLLNRTPRSRTKKRVA
jgi:transcriptional regulator with XRE-family HTH domain